MKTPILFSSVLMALSVLLARGQSQQPPPEISVSGSAEVKVVPDEVNISAGVETRDAQLNNATRQNDERVATALAFLRKAGVPDKYIRTDSIQVQPDYGNDNSLVEPRFYRVRKSIEVKLTGTTNLETVVTGLLNNGVNNLYHVDFRTTELRKYRDQARSMAIKVAHEKAAALAGDLDVKCGKPININAQDYGGYYSWPGNGWGGQYGGYYMNSAQNMAQASGGGAEVGGDTVSIGQISVSATVNVSFLIQ